MRLTLTADENENPDDLLRVLHAMGATLNTELVDPHVDTGQVSVTIRVAPAVRADR